MNGSAIPANPGVNPLTITAFAERTMSLCANKGHADERQPLGSGYERIAPVMPNRPEQNHSRDFRDSPLFVFRFAFFLPSGRLVFPGGRPDPLRTSAFAESSHLRASSTAHSSRGSPPLGVALQDSPTAMDSHAALGVACMDPPWLDLSTVTGMAF